LVVLITLGISGTFYLHEEKKKLNGILDWFAARGQASNWDDDKDPLSNVFLPVILNIADGGCPSWAKSLPDGFHINLGENPCVKIIL
jgi:hypothetical protein